MSITLSNLKQVNIKTKILTVVLLIGIVSMGVAGFQGYLQGRAALQETAFNNLTAIRTTKARQIEDYFGQIRNQVVTLSENRMVVEAMGELKEAFHEADQGMDQDEIQAFQGRLEGYYQNEFLSRLQANTGRLHAVEAFLPDEAQTLVLQNHYIAANANAVGEKDHLDQADDDSRYSLTTLIRPMTTVAIAVSTPATTRSSAAISRSSATTTSSSSTARPATSSTPSSRK